MKRGLVLVVALVGVLLAVRLLRRSAEPPAADRADQGLVDHHVHILGPDLIRDWKSLGVTFSRPDSIYLSASSLLAQRGDSVGAVVLVPMGHLYANPEFSGGLQIDSAGAHRRVRVENALVAAEAARFPGRAVALCSVPALAPWAVEDLGWCRDSLNSAGIKLHLASSQIDLRDTSHLARLSAIASWASRHALPILVHVDPQRRGHDSTHIRRLAERVFEPYPDLTVVVAHLGGSGGYGAWTQTVHRALRQWLQHVERAGPKRHVYFEVSAVALERESEGVPPISPDESAQLRDDLRADSLDRVLFGSDYPVFDPLNGVRALRERIGLTEAELSRLTARAASPFFRTDRR
jgi:predicted TIM-barrel fold metal-dependent hydrolase